MKPLKTKHESRYKVSQFDLMNRCWSTLDVKPDREQAIKLADFYGNLTIVEELNGPDIKMIFVSKK